VGQAMGRGILMARFSSEADLWAEVAALLEHERTSFVEPERLRERLADLIERIDMLRSSATRPS
jgi:hypothetical protein